MVTHNREWYYLKNKQASDIILSLHCHAVIAYKLSPIIMHASLLKCNKTGSTSSSLNLGLQ